MYDAKKRQWHYVSSEIHVEFVLELWKYYLSYSVAI